MIFLYLFVTFFEIGLFGFGGGYGMLSLIQNETVEHWHWMTASEFTDIVAISQMTPGPIGINLLPIAVIQLSSMQATVLLLPSLALRQQPSH